MHEEIELRGHRVLIVEDHAAMRRSLQIWIEESLPAVAVATAGSLSEALEELGRAVCDVVLLDARLPDGDGIAGTRALHARCARSRVVVCSLLDDDRHAARALAAGAAAFVSKRRLREELLPALRQALATRPDEAPGP